MLLTVIKDDCYFGGVHIGLLRDGSLFMRMTGSGKK